MNDKILVAYATRAGSTVEVAEFIGGVLCEHGSAVDVRPVKEVQSLDGYRAVVAGSAIRMGKWLPEAVQFVETHKEALSRMPRAYFLVSLFLAGASPDKEKEINAYLDPVRQILEPDYTGLFPGKLDPQTLSFLDRQIAKMVKSREGDFRDWDAMRAWAEGLAQNGFGAGA